MFGFEIVCYLFLGGLSGGLCVVSAVSGLTVPAEQLRRGPGIAQRRILAVSFTACAGGLVLSALLLLADAGNLSALKYLILSSRLNYLVVGAWAIALSAALSLLLAIMWRAPSRLWSVGLVRLVLVLECLMGAFVVLYTGLFLASMKAVALWSTPWLVLLFACSSTSCALIAFVALTNACGLSATFARWVNVLVKADLVVLVLELVCAAGFVFAALAFDAVPSAVSAAQASAWSLVAGDLAVAWWGGFILLGVVAAGVLEISLLRARQPLPAYSFQVLALVLCSFAGGLFMRYCVVAAGLHPVLGF